MLVLSDSVVQLDPLTPNQEIKQLQSRGVSLMAYPPPRGDKSVTSVMTVGVIIKGIPATPRGSIA